MPTSHLHDRLLRQIHAAILHHRFHPPLPTPSPTFPGFTPATVDHILTVLPSLLRPPHTVGSQSPSPPSLPLSVQALHLLSWLPHPSSPSFLLPLASSLSLSPHPRLLWDLLSSHKHLISTPILTSVISSLGRARRGKDAVMLFYRMKQFRCVPDLRAYNAVVAAACEAGEGMKARSFVEQMELPGFKFPPDAVTYTILVSYHCKRALVTGCRKAVRRRIWEANRVFRRMVVRGVEPDVVTFNCLIDACCKTYRIGRALELFEEMGRRGCMPNRVTYNSFVRYYAAVNEVEEAVRMVRRMVERGHGVASSSCYTPIVHALCEGGRAEEAKGFVKEMVDGGLVPREYTYMLVREALARDGKEGLDGELCRRIEEGIERRFRQTMKAKPIMSRKGY